MSRRGRSLFLVLLMGLLPQIGCVTFLGEAQLPELGHGELPAKKASQVCLALAETQEAEGHENEAIVQYERARLYDPSLRRVARRLAVLYDREGNADRALAEYQQAIACQPRDADLHNDLGYFYYQRGKWAEAEASFRAALTLNPGHRHALNNLGMTLAQQQNYQESLATFTKAVSPADAYCNLAFILMTQGKLPEARQAYQRALEYEPDLDLARKALASIDKNAARGGADHETQPGGEPVPAVPSQSEPTLKPSVSGVSGLATAGAEKPAGPWAPNER